MKEIEMLLMSTENELRGQPSLPVSHTRICVWIQEGETCDSTIYVLVFLTLALRTVVGLVFFVCA